MKNFVKQIRPVFSISYHSYSEIVIYPYGCEGQHTPTQEVVEKIGIPESTQFIREMANGTPVAGLTTAARAVVMRWDARVPK